MSYKKLILIRGLPGSGKTVDALTYKSMGYYHFEADQFFIQNGEYKYDPSQIGRAHAQCQLNCLNAMRNSVPIVISNTFVQRWEMEIYKQLASVFGYEVEVIVKKGTWNNIHNVSNEIIAKMKEKWED